jgi:hypothetical protein
MMPRCGADTLVCRVETRLDAFRTRSETPLAVQETDRGEKRREESRRGRHECLRHIDTLNETT